MVPSFLQTILPLIVFGSASAIAIRFILLDALDAGLIDKLETACIPSSPYSLSYTGFHSIDHSLCQLVALMKDGLGSNASHPILQYFLASAPVVSMFIAVEASRNRGRYLPSYLAYPVVFGQLWQVMSWGFILSVYSLLFVVSGSSQRSPGSLAQNDALAILVAFGVGSSMHLHGSYLFSPYIITVWLLFPAAMALTQKLVRNSLPSTTKFASGHDVIIAGYVLTFIIGASFHFALVFPHFSINQVLEFAPSTQPVNAQTGSLEDILVHLMKWDVPIGSVAILLTTLWFAKSFKQLVVLAFTIVGGSIVVGPAAALAAILIWREARIQG